MVLHADINMGGKKKPSRKSLPKVASQQQGCTFTFPVFPVAATFVYSVLLLVLFSSAPTAVSSMSPLLQGKRVLVTGAGRGIGRAIALICQEQGAQVAIASRTREQLVETSTQASSTSICPPSSISPMSLHVVDVTNVSEIEAMVEKIRKDWGGLDILINNAGGAQPTKGSVDTLDAQDLTNLLELNVVGVHAVTSAVLRGRLMEQGGHIVNISSKAGKVGLANMSLYVASKFALEGLTSSWAKELKEQNIVVTSLSPGMVNTQSFPKSPGRPGVRTAESIKDCLLLAATASLDYTGHYMHADELDMVRSKGLSDTTAWKPIDEVAFENTLE